MKREFSIILVFLMGLMMISFVFGAGYNIVVPDAGGDGGDGGGGGGGGGGDATPAANDTADDTDDGSADEEEKGAVGKIADKVAEAFDNITKGKNWIWAVSAVIIMVAVLGVLYWKRREK